MKIQNNVTLLLLVIAYHVSEEELFVQNVINKVLIRS